MAYEPVKGRLDIIVTEGLVGLSSVVETCREAAQAITALERERDTLAEALRRIAAMTNADDPESYRADDREGCLDTVNAVALKTLGAPND